MTPRHRARDIILRYGWNSTAFQILNPGIELWFAHTSDAVIGFVTSGRFRIVAGEPVCAPEHLATVIAEFEDNARRQNKRVCYFCAQDRLAKLFRQAPSPQLLSHQGRGASERGFPSSTRDGRGQGKGESLMCRMFRQSLLPQPLSHQGRGASERGSPSPPCGGKGQRKGGSGGVYPHRQRVKNSTQESCLHARVAIGAQPVWDPQRWPAIVKSKSSLRAQIARARNKQITIARWSCEQSHNHPLLARCLDEWLQTRGLPPMHFLVEPDTLACLGCRHTYVASRGEHVVAFLVASPIPLRNGWLIEQIVRCKDAPNGTAEYLIDYAMRDLAAEGASYVTLGLSPLSRRAEIPLPMQPLWLRLLFVWTRSHGRRFYNFDGLDAFKAKMMPDYWEPVYAITNEPQFSLQALYAIAGAFSGMSPVLFVGRGVWRAVRQEVRWLLQM